MGDQAEQAPYTLLGASALVGLFLSTRLGYQALKIVTRSGLHIGLATATRELADNFLSHVR